MPVENRDEPAGARARSATSGEGPPQNRASAGSGSGKDLLTRLFGTDGIRAPFGEPPLDRATVTALAEELGETLTAQAGGDRPARVVIGGDTRDSTPALTSWVAEGLAAAGVAALDAGVVPTPGVAFLVRAAGAVAGVSISASHNHHPDNGIKLIDAEGFKWSAAAEAALERRLEARLENGPSRGGVSGAPGVGRSAEPLDPAPYLDALAASGGGDGARPLSGLRIALDTAHGAATPYARALFERLGAEVVATLGDTPDGININRECGSTKPGALAAAVVERGADLGLAFDGDADRLIPVDGGGRVRDGDDVLYLWASSLRREGRLEPSTIVATSMSNLGLTRALQREGVRVELCDVGDRKVVERMREKGIVLGGEQSGHIVHLGLTTTGDGLLTGVQLAALIARTGRPMAELLTGFERYPQELDSVRVAVKPPLESLPRVAAAESAARARLGEEGRVVLRYSGTEPLARVMIEGRDHGLVLELVGEIKAAIQAEIGLGAKAGAAGGTP